jgi:hypothetical protein
MDRDLTVKIKQRRVYSPARVPAIFSGEVRRGWTAAALQ